MHLEKSLVYLTPPLVSFLLDIKLANPQDICCKIFIINKVSTMFYFDKIVN